MEEQLSHIRYVRFLRGASKIRVSQAQIIRMEAMSNYTRVYFMDQAPILMAKVLHAYDQLLNPYGFVRTHRSHLVNVAHITCVDEKGEMLMSDSSRVVISRRKRHEVLTKLIAQQS